MVRDQVYVVVHGSCPSVMSYGSRYFIAW
jgi:hypothetical protein